MNNAVKEKLVVESDVNTLTDLEKNFLRKEKILQEETEKISNESKAKDDKIASILILTISTERSNSRLDHEAIPATNGASQSH